MDGCAYTFRKNTIFMLDCALQVELESVGARAGSERDDGVEETPGLVSGEPGLRRSRHALQ